MLKHKQHASRLCTFARCLVSKTIPVFLNLLWSKPKSIFFFCFPIISTMPVSSCCRGSQWLRTYHDTISVIPVSAQVSCVCVSILPLRYTHTKCSGLLSIKTCSQSLRERVFSKLTSKRRHTHHCLSLTSGGKWSFFEILVCEFIDRLTVSLDNQQQCLCFRQRPPTVYPLSLWNIFSPPCHFTESTLGLKTDSALHCTVGIRWRLALGWRFEKERGCAMFLRLSIKEAGAETEMGAL